MAMKFLLLIQRFAPAGDECLHWATPSNLERSGALLAAWVAV
jgi:hypothetical protein